MRIFVCTEQCQQSRPATTTPTTPNQEPHQSICLCVDDDGSDEDDDDNEVEEANRINCKHKIIFMLLNFVETHTNTHIHVRCDIRLVRLDPIWTQRTLLFPKMLLTDKVIMFGNVESIWIESCANRIEQKRPLPISTQIYIQSQWYRNPRRNCQTHTYTKHNTYLLGGVMEFLSPWSRIFVANRKLDA